MPVGDHRLEEQLDFFARAAERGLAAREICSPGVRLSRIAGPPEGRSFWTSGPAFAGP